MRQSGFATTSAPIPAQDSTRFVHKSVNMKDLADLHIHTTASDGAWTPTQVVQAAADKGLGAIAITDHDTIDGLSEALEAGRRAGVIVVPGLEISAIHGAKTEVHVLGYFFDHQYAELVEQLHILKNSRESRGRKIVEQLNEAGVNITFERVSELAQGGAIGRPHVARALCEIGAVNSIDAAFGRWLQEGAPGYVPRYKISPNDAVRLILNAGGAAVCAHPGKQVGDEILVEMIDQGMCGVEARHPDHGPVTTRYYEKFAAKRALIATGGSDSHCIQGGKRTDIGSVTVSVDVVDQLKEAAAQRRK